MYSEGQHAICDMVSSNKYTQECTVCLSLLWSFELQQIRTDVSSSIKAEQTDVQFQSRLQITVDRFTYKMPSRNGKEDTAREVCVTPVIKICCNIYFKQ